MFIVIRELGILIQNSWSYWVFGSLFETKLLKVYIDRSIMFGFNTVKKTFNTTGMLFIV